MTQYDPQLHRERLGQRYNQDWPPQAPPPRYAPAPAPPRKKRRVFLWVFLAIQALFVIWLITGIAGVHNAAANCHDQYLTHTECAQATDAGGALGAGLIVALWVAADFILAVGYAIYRLAGRRT